MISVKGLSKSYDGILALDGTDMNIPDASIYGLVGTNGAGKTTVIKLLAGVLRQDAGDIEFDGEKVWENEALKQRIAVIPDDFYFPTSYTLSKMRDMYKGMYKEWNDERFHEMTRSFKLDENRKIRTFSKGMKKQVAFCLAMSVMPDFLLLDEPIDGLDPIVRKQVWKYIVDDVAGRGMSVLVSSHNLKEMEGICDRIGILQDGHMRVEKDMESLVGDLHKIQVSFGKNKPSVDPYEGLNVIHKESRGTVDLLLVGDPADRIRDVIGKSEPLVFDILPLTLEEVFIHELGGDDDAINQLLF